MNDAQKKEKKKKINDAQKKEKKKEKRKWISLVF